MWGSIGGGKVVKRDGGGPPQSRKHLGLWESLWGSVLERSPLIWGCCRACCSRDTEVEAELWRLQEGEDGSRWAHVWDPVPGDLSLPSAE